MRIALTGFFFAGFAACAIAADEPQPAVNIPGLSPPPGQSVPAATPAPEPAKPIIATLNDGSRVEFDADDTVWVTAPDGSRTPAPDGTLTLRDGVPFEVRSGKRVEE